MAIMYNFTFCVLHFDFHEVIWGLLGFLYLYFVLTYFPFNFSIKKKDKIYLSKSYTSYFLLN